MMEVRALKRGRVWGSSAAAAAAAAVAPPQARPAGWLAGWRTKRGDCALCGEAGGRKLSGASLPAAPSAAERAAQ